MSTLTPYLTCAGAARAIEFYTAAFGAVETERWTADDGRIGHCSLLIGDAPVYLSDEYLEVGAASPGTLGGTSVALVLTVPDADQTAARAAEAGAEVYRPVTDQPGGERAGWIRDPFGHRWNLRSVAVPAQPPTGRVGDFEITRPD
jgi:PhnB protein